MPLFDLQNPAQLSAGAGVVENIPNMQLVCAHRLQRFYGLARDDADRADTVTAYDE
jgi:hypothetical protein